MGAELLQEISSQLKDGRSNFVFNLQLPRSERPKAEIPRGPSVSRHREGGACGEAAGGAVQREGGAGRGLGEAGGARGEAVVGVEDGEVLVAVGLAGGSARVHRGGGGEGGAGRERPVHELRGRRPRALPQVVRGRSLLQRAVPRAVQLPSLRRRLEKDKICFCFLVCDEF